MIKRNEFSLQRGRALVNPGGAQSRAAAPQLRGVS